MAKYYSVDRVWQEQYRKGRKIHYRGVVRRPAEAVPTDSRVGPGPAGQSQRLLTWPDILQILQGLSSLIALNKRANKTAARNEAKRLFVMVGSKGFEPSTSGV